MTLHLVTVLLMRLKNAKKVSRMNHMPDTDRVGQAQSFFLPGTIIINVNA